MIDRNIKNIENGVYFGYYDSFFMNTFRFYIPNVGMLVSENTDYWTKEKFKSLLRTFKIDYTGMNIDDMRDSSDRIRGIPIKIICKKHSCGTKIDVHGFELLEKEVETIIEVDSFYEN